MLVVGNDEETHFIAFLILVEVVIILITTHKTTSVPTKFNYAIVIVKNSGGSCRSLSRPMICGIGRKFWRHTVLMETLWANGAWTGLAKTVQPIGPI